MNKEIDINYIRLLVALIESRLNWGNSSEWTNYDFEKLSVAIQDATGVALSVTTLKRLWGKLKYDNAPAVTTLNTLAKYAGYEDWRAFKSVQQAAAPAGSSAPALAPVIKKQPRRPYWLLVFLILPVILYTTLASKVNKVRKPEDYAFSSNKVIMEGVPNSVIFHYNAAAAGKDSVYIAQSWDVSRKRAVDAQQHAYSSIYYIPGYFRAKLIVGGQIVKEHDLMITSGGWLALIEKGDGVPLYFKKGEYLTPDGVKVDTELLTAYHIPLQPEQPSLRVFNVRDMEGIKDDDFTFETTLKSDYHQGAGACQRVQVLILCKNDMVLMPLCAKGCVGDLGLYAAGAGVMSKEADLSRFGCDLDQWVHVKVVAKGHLMQFFVNDTLAYTLETVHEGMDIVGVEYRFNGTGAVKGTRFMNEKRAIKL